jgi:hypothetical protein
VIPISLPVFADMVEILCPAKRAGDMSVLACR